jgi:hypothetical protein
MFSRKAEPTWVKQLYPLGQTTRLVNKHDTMLERPARDKHVSLLDPWVSYEKSVVNMAQLIHSDPNKMTEKKIRLMILSFFRFCH